MPEGLDPQRQPLPPSAMHTREERAVRIADRRNRAGEHPGPCGWECRHQRVPAAKRHTPAPGPERPGRASSHCGPNPFRSKCRGPAPANDRLRSREIRSARNGTRSRDARRTPGSRRVRRPPDARTGRSAPRTPPRPTTGRREAAPAPTSTHAIFRSFSASFAIVHPDRIGRRTQHAGAAPAPSPPEEGTVLRARTPRSARGPVRFSRPKLGNYSQ